VIKFEISYRGGTTHEVELAGSVAVLGRDPACDVVLNDSKCSRRHAIVEDGPNGFVVRDLGSANGIYVNGRQVREGPLRPGDLLRLGDVHLKLLAEVGETIVVGPDDLGPDLTERERPRAVSRRSEPAGLPRRPAVESRRSEAEPRSIAASPRRPTTVSVLVALWALFVPLSVGACLYAAHRLGGGALPWAGGALASLVLAALGTSMALGLRALAPWARHLQIAAAAAGLLACPLTLASATLLLYLTRPEVKAAFEAAPARPPGDDPGDATFALSFVGMLVVGVALVAIAALVL
jgi:FHA domain